jgi:hypothetical protein
MKSGIFCFIAFSVMSQIAHGNNLPPDVLDATPDIYSCAKRNHSHWDPEEGFRIARDGNAYELSFLKSSRGFSEHKQQHLKLGTIEQYLKPLGIDARIIAHYSEWELAPITIPVDTCRAKNFGSLYAEELHCDADDLKLTLNAVHKTNGETQIDTYTFNDVKLRLKTKVKPGIKGTYCPAGVNNEVNQSVVLDLAVEFSDQRGNPVQIKDTMSFHPDCAYRTPDSGDGGSQKIRHGYCGLTGGIRFSIGVADLIKIRD